MGALGSGREYPVDAHRSARSLASPVSRQLLLTLPPLPHCSTNIFRLAWVRIPAAHHDRPSGCCSCDERDPRAASWKLQSREAKHPGCPGDVSGDLSCYFFPPDSQECIERVQRLKEDEVVQVGANATIGATRSGTGSAGEGKWSLCEDVMEAALSDSVAVQPGMRCFSDRALVPSLVVASSGHPLSPAMAVAVPLPPHQHCTAQGLWPGCCHEAGFAQAVTEDGLSSFASAPASPSLDNRRANETLVHDMAMQDRLGKELFAPRPMLHMHVRQGDKIQLGKAESVATWMRAAMLLRVHDPSLHRMWISTDTQEVLDIAKQYRHWRVYWFGNEPKWDPKSQSQKKTGKRELRASVESSLLNLMLVVECDYSVMALDSNRNRVIPSSLYANHWW
ncbi:unnamed protein product [Closterium sp. Naga37s-1]|nr:unnamed protein product [Closterium sp. Naga37s-1]